MAWRVMPIPPSPSCPPILPMSDVVRLYDEADRLKAEGKLEEAVAKLEQSLQLDDAYALAHSA